MNVNVNIHETVNGDLFVKELCLQEGEYAKDEAGQNDTVMFQYSASVTVLEKVTPETSYTKAFIHSHDNQDVSNRFPVSKDGWYKVHHIVVPNDKWLEYAKKQNGMLDKFQTVWIAKDGKLHKRNGETLTETAVDELVTDGTSNNTWRADKDVFVIFNLWQCYLNWCKRTFESECSKNLSCPDCDNELTKARGLLWVFLNAIQYYIRFGQFQEAQELLDEITGGCNTLCRSEMFMKDYECGCG